jgi:hypothetical protein
MPYASHGNYTIQIYQDVVHVILSGETNVELFSGLSKQLDTIRETLSARRWALVLDLRKWDLSPLDFLQKAQEHSARIGLSGRYAEVEIIVTADDFIPSLINSLIGEIDTRSTLYWVNDLVSARRTLSELGFGGAGELGTI